MPALTHVLIVHRSDNQQVIHVSGHPDREAATKKADAVGATLYYGKGAGAEPTALVEKVKLSEDEAEEFERKRFELRTLIQKMWEENKEGKPPS